MCARDRHPDASGAGAPRSTIRSGAPDDQPGWAAGLSDLFGPGWVFGAAQLPADESRAGDPSPGNPPAGGAGVPAAGAAGDRRHREHQLGRRALRRVLAGLGDPTDPATVRFPHPRLSLTHSGGVALAVGTLDHTGAGVGIDLEPVAPVNPRAARLFLTGAEQAWWRTAAEPDALLRLWTVKEAVFKADLGNDGRILADYELSRPAGWTGHASRGATRFRYRSARLSGFMVSLAVPEEDPA